MNKELAEDLIAGRPCGHIGAFVEKAKNIADLANPTIENIREILSGEKTKTFFVNIYNYDNRVERYAGDVTIDRHAMKIATNLDIDSVTNPQLKWLSECYVYATKYIQDLESDLTITPQLVQSATWCVWRGIPMAERKRIINPVKV